MDFKCWFNEFMLLSQTKDPAKAHFFKMIPKLFDTEIDIVINKLYLVTRFLVEEKDKEIEKLKTQIKEMENEKHKEKDTFDTDGDSGPEWRTPEHTRTHSWPGL